MLARTMIFSPVLRGSCAIVLGILVPVLAGLPVPGPAGAQPAVQVELALVGQPVWHSLGDNLKVRVRITNTGGAALEGYRLVIGVYDRLQTRSALHSSYDLAQTEAPSSFPILFEDETVDAGSSINKRIEDPLSSSVLLSGNAVNGIYPVKITLQDSGGVALDTVTTQLIYYANPPTSAGAGLGLSLVLPISDRAARGADGVFGPDEGGSHPLEEATAGDGRLTRLIEAIEEPTAEATPPLGIAPSARLLEELADMADGYRRDNGERVENIGPDDPRVRAARDRLDRLRAILADADHQLLAAPYAFPDLPSISGFNDAIAKQLAEAVDVVEEVLGRQLNTEWVFAPGGRLDATVLQQLRLAGAGGNTFFSPEVLEPPGNPESSGCPTESLSFTCPVSVEAPAGGSVTGYMFDEELQQRLADIAGTEDTRLHLQRFFAETAMIREESPAVAGRVVAAEVPMGWHPTGRELSILLGGLRRAPWVDMLTPANGLERAEETGEQQLHGQLPAPRLQPSAVYFQEVAAAEEAVESFESASPPAEIVERLRRNVLVALAAAWWGEHEAAGARYARASAAEASEELSKIGIIAAKETTLTSRRGKIQLVVFNDTGYEVQVNLRLTSQGLSLDESVRQLRIGRSQQIVTFDVVARASGIFPLGVSVETPDGRRTAASTTITIRSTEFNQIALGITVGALAFLILFYIGRAVRHRWVSKRRPHETEAGTLGEPRPGRRR